MKKRTILNIAKIYLECEETDVEQMNLIVKNMTNNFSDLEDIIDTAPSPIPSSYDEKQYVKVQISRVNLLINKYSHLITQEKANLLNPKNKTDLELMKEEYNVMLTHQKIIESSNTLSSRLTDIDHCKLMLIRNVIDMSQ